MKKFCKQKNATRIQNILTNSVWHFSYICDYNSKDSWWNKITRPHFSQNIVSRASLPTQLSLYDTRTLIFCKFKFDFRNILIPLCCCFSCKSIICVLNLKSNFSYLYFLAINEILSNDRAFISAPSAEWGLLNTNRSRIFRALRVYEACLVLTSSIMPNECCNPS